MNKQTAVTVTQWDTMQQFFKKYTYMATQRDLKIVRINEKSCKSIHRMIAFTYTFKYYVLDIDAHDKGLKQGQKGFMPT